MKKFWLAVLGLGVVGCGCSPRLAQTPYGDKELEWQTYINKGYSSWKPPQTVPPVEEKTAEPTEKVVIEKDTMEIFGPADSTTPVAVFEKDTVTVIPAGGETYVVEKNDSLWKISQKFYKDGRKWGIIKDANAEVLKGRDSVLPGMKLRIPPQ